jgi:hypothetical protein
VILELHDGYAKAFLTGQSNVKIQHGLPSLKNKKDIYPMTAMKLWLKPIDSSTYEQNLTFNSDRYPSHPRHFLLNLSLQIIANHSEFRSDPHLNLVKRISKNEWFAIIPLHSKLHHVLNEQRSFHSPLPNLASITYRCKF